MTVHYETHPAGGLAVCDTCGWRDYTRDRTHYAQLRRDHEWAVHGSSDAAYRATDAAGTARRRAAGGKS